MKDILSLLMVCLLGLSVEAAIIYVSPTGDDVTGDGSLAYPYASPANAVSKAKPADEVVLLHGRYESCARIAWNYDITVRGETENARDTVLDFNGATWADCAIAFTKGSIRNLTVSNACTTGVWLKGGETVLASNIVVTCCDNMAGGNTAGGVQLSMGTLMDSVVTHCFHKKNGAGVIMSGNGTRVIGCEITFNEAGAENAGGILSSATDTCVSNTLVAYNLARYAAGIANATVIDGCRILCNTTGVERYHGQYSDVAGTLGTAVLGPTSGSLRIARSVISGNVTFGTSAGNAVWNRAGQIEIIDTEISNNIGRMWGGALYSEEQTQLDKYPASAIVVRGGTIHSNTNGNAGASVFSVDKSTMSFTGTVFSNNYALASAEHGGVDSWDGGVGRVTTAGVLACTNCTFNGNCAADHGGVLSNSGIATFVNCSFMGNEAKGGGGVIQVNSSAAVTVFENCAFTNNVTARSGGVFLAMDSIGGDKMPVNLTAVGCRFVGNRAGVDGGVFRLRSNSQDTSVILRNCLFDGNGCVSGADGTGGGGVFYAVVDKADVSNCTFVNNYTKGSFGSVFYSKWSSNVQVKNCAFANNIIYKGLANETIASTKGFYAAVDYQNDLLWPAESNTFLTEEKYCVTADPKWNTMYMQVTSSSPLVDAGMNEDWMINALDIRSARRKPRIYNNIVDIGCYEYVPFPGMTINIR